ncbi:ketopantoate reductase family protein [Mesorhizobium sp.]|uniref:ketopantoate reductase family protein n=1 Tax=Mesorhizobium sp. TaxID=1871066 RepID=UPI0025D2E7B7|nr:2-dehydropantoate 2-reductase N-terminal domain-containing protein [Mesorhizobium sp.]
MAAWLHSIHAGSAASIGPASLPRKVVILDEIPKVRPASCLSAKLGLGLMCVTVFGAGAIGGYLAAKLAIAGNVDLSIVARGAHLDAVKANSLRLIEDGHESVAPVRAAARAESWACRTMSCLR